MRLFSALFLALALIPALGRAFPGVPDEYPNGIDFDLDPVKLGQYARLVVTRGPLRAPVPGVPLFNQYGRLDVDADARRETIIVRYERLSSTATVALPLAVLESRLANAEAMARHRRKDYAASAAGFAKALALDPTFDLAATNLACAYAMSGQLQKALDAVRPLIARNPFMLYRRILSDPELRPLRERPEIAAMRASPEGTAVFDPKAFAFAGGAVAYSSRYHLVAALSKSSRYNEEAGPTTFDTFRMVVLDPDSSRVVDEWTLAPGSEASLARLWPDLGFEVPRQQSIIVSPGSVNIKPPEPRFPGLDWEFHLAGDSSKIQLERNGKVFARTAELKDPYINLTPQYLQSAAYVPSLKLFVGFYGWFSGEGGGDWKYEAPVVLKVP